MGQSRGSRITNNNMQNFDLIKSLVSDKLTEMGRPTQAKAVKYAVNKGEIISYLFGQFMTEKEAECLYNQCAAGVQNSILK